MQGKNGTGKPASCTNCGMAIKSEEMAIYDGEDWFCDTRCLGQWSGRRAGNVPA